jgi:hypothetical protein
MTPVAHNIHSSNGTGRPFEGNVQVFGAGPNMASLKDHIAKLAISKPAEPSGFLAGLLNISDQIKVRTENTIVFPPALFWQDDEPVIWPRTITLIQGQTGTHKSRVAERFGSAILKEGPNGRQGDSLGISFRPVEGVKYRVIYIDTERNLPDQLPFAMQSLKQRAGYEFGDHPTELFCTSLVNIPRKQRFAALIEFLTDQRSKFSGHIIVILDVLSDCVSDFNDVEASLELMDSLNVAVNEKDVTFLAVLHENPGTGTAKARGHLGTEASNKASTILQVSFVKEKGVAPGLIQLMYLKRRYAAAGCAFFATYDQEAKGLVRAKHELVEAVTTASQTTTKCKVSPAQVVPHLPDLLTNCSLPAGELEAKLAKRLGISERSVMKLLPELLKPGAGYIEDSIGRPCFLTKVKAPIGLQKLYSLKPVFESTTT